MNTDKPLLKFKRSSEAINNKLTRFEPVSDFIESRRRDKRQSEVIIAPALWVYPKGAEMVHLWGTSSSERVEQEWLPWRTDSRRGRRCFTSSTSNTIRSAMKRTILSGNKKSALCGRCVCQMEDDRVDRTGNPCRSRKSRAIKILAPAQVN